MTTLSGTLWTRGVIATSGQIQATYDPTDVHTILSLYDVDDGMLGSGAVPP